MWNKDKRPRSWLETLVSVPTSLLWFLLVAVLVVLTFPTALELLRSLRKANYGGLSLEFAAAKLEVLKIRGMDLAPLSDRDSQRLLNRMGKAGGEALERTSILWVDDETPRKNGNLLRVVKSMGITLDQATSSYDACLWMWDAHYDIIISDFRRNRDVKESCSEGGIKESPACKLFKFIKEKNNKSNWPKLFIFESPERLENVGKPENADGMTSSPVDILDMILSSVEELPSPPDRSLERGIGKKDSNTGDNCDPLLPPEPPI